MARVVVAILLLARSTFASPVDLANQAVFIYTQCPNLVAQLTSATKSTSQKVSSWYHGTKPMPQEEFEKLKTTLMGSFFPKKVVTQDDIKAVSESLIAYTSELEKTPNGGHKIPDETKARDQILSTLRSHLNQAPPPHWANMRLDDLFSQTHYQIRQPLAGKAAMGPSRAYRATKAVPKQAIIGAASIILAQTIWNFKMIMYNGTDVVNLPFQNFVNQFMNHFAGFVGEGLTLALNQVQEAAFSAFNNDMSQTLNDLDKKLSDFESEKVNEAELNDFALESKKAFLKIRTALYAHLPDMIAMGRNYFSNGFMFFPLTFQNAASTTNIEVMMHENRIYEWSKDPNVPPAQIEKEKRRLAAARKRMGTILALRDIHVLFYPEYTSKFMDKNGHKITRSFETISDGLGFEEYGKEYVAEMRDMLDRLGAVAKTGNAKPFFEAEKKMAEKVADIAGVPLAQSKPD